MTILLFAAASCAAATRLFCGFAKVNTTPGIFADASTPRAPGLLANDRVVPHRDISLFRSCCCRRPKPGARLRAFHPPTREPQTCRTYRHALPAAHFSEASQNRTGRFTQCKACDAAAHARRLAARPPPKVPQRKVCLECCEELPAAAFGLRHGATGGLQSYCRNCQAKRIAEQQKSRAPSQLPPPPSIVCAACREEKPLSAFPRQRAALFSVRYVCHTCDNARVLRAYHAAKLQRAASSATSDSNGNDEAAGGGKAAKTSRQQRAATAASSGVSGGDEAAGGSEAAGVSEAAGDGEVAGYSSAA